MQKKTVNVLGTEYTIETHKTSDDSYLKNNNFSGYCDEEEKLIVIADTSEKEFFGELSEMVQKSYSNKTLRHELIHAFLNESGLSANAMVSKAAWSKNEEMVDWLAIQLPKIFKLFQELDILY